MIGARLTSDEDEADVSARNRRIATRAGNMLQKTRLAPDEYVQASDREKNRLGILLGSTMVLRHVLMHPRYGKALQGFLGDLIHSLAPRLEELKSGKLLTWEQQEELDHEG